MDFLQECTNVLTWGVSKDEQIINNKDKDESVSIIKYSWIYHYNYD